MRVITQPRSMFVMALGVSVGLWLGCNRPAVADEGELEPATDATESKEVEPAKSLDLGEPAKPIIEPTESPAPDLLPQNVQIPAPTVDIDPAVIGVAPGDTPPALLREGQYIVNRRGQLKRIEDTGLVLLVFEPRPDRDTADLPMVMQACRALETIENLIEKREGDTTLRVSGQVHTYRGANYLMPTVLTPAPEIIPEIVVEEVAPDPTPTTPAPPVSDDAKPVDDVMQQLLALRKTPGLSKDDPDTTRDRDRPLIESLDGLDAAIPIVEIDPALLGISPGDDVPPLRREGDFAMNRRGRLVHAGGGGRTRLFVFEADTAESGELPMILQPCLLLESMEDIVLQRGDTVVFVISGQIHTYRGANYLLPTMMKLAVDRGNLLN